MKVSGYVQKLDKDHAMLEWTPTETRDFLHNATANGDQRVIIGPPEDDDKVRLLFKSAAENKVYLLELRGDRDWIRALCAEVPDIDTTARMAEFIGLGLDYWPHDQSMQRMRALLEFHAAKHGGV